MEIMLDDHEVEMMAKLAILASIPLGMGMLHHKPDLTIEEMTNVKVWQTPQPVLSIDYYMGRMVKFHARKIDKTTWAFADAIDSEYQSWINKYPDYYVLAEAAIQELTNVQP